MCSSVIVFVCILALVHQAHSSDNYESVSPFIGSGGPGFGYGGINPGVQLPFSPFRLGPDTTSSLVDISFRHFSGYHYLDSSIRGFSHTHLVGAGVNDLGHLGVMPVLALDADWKAKAEADAEGASPSPNRFWWSTFSKTSEKAKPGFYSVFLDAPQAQAELLAVGSHAGVHRYSWKKHVLLPSKPGLVIDLCHSAKLELEITGSVPCLDASISISADMHSFDASVLLAGGLSGKTWKYLHGEINTYVTNVSEDVGDTVTSTSGVASWASCSGTSSEYSSVDDSRSQASRLTCESGVQEASSTSGTLFAVASIDPSSSLASNSQLSDAGEFVVELRVGISAISTDIARENLLQSTSSSIIGAGSRDHMGAKGSAASFESLRERTEDIWRRKLSSVSFSTIGEFDDKDEQRNAEGDETVKEAALSSEAEEDGVSSASMRTMLASALYRTYMSPSDYTEAGGLYRGMGGEVHNVTAERLEKYPDSITASSSVRPAPWTLPVVFDAQEDGNPVSGDPAYRFFSDFSFWDTFRTQHPWLLLTDERLSIGILRSIAEITDQQQAFPRWVLGSHEGSCMIGLHGSAAVLEALLTGSIGGDDFDVEVIQKLLQFQSTDPSAHINGRTDVEHYMQFGYVSLDATEEAASHTLSYAFDDYVLAGISKYTGAKEDAESAQERSSNFASIWSDDAHIFCPRSASTKEESGELQCPESPIGPFAWSHYKEGDALHWKWYVPHSPESLIALYQRAEVVKASSAAGEIAGGGGFFEELEDFFVQHVKFRESKGREAVTAPSSYSGGAYQELSMTAEKDENAARSIGIDAFPINSALPNPYYWAGNEHDIQAVWMFNYGESAASFSADTREGTERGGGQCTRTQYWSRRLVTMHFSATPHGLPGNDDYGAMSSWLLFTALGVYPQAATTTFYLGSPSVESADITLVRANGEEAMLSVIAHNNTASNFYVRELRVNGEVYTQPFIERAVLVGDTQYGSPSEGFVGKSKGEIKGEGGSIAVPRVTLEFYMHDEPTSGLCPL